MLLKLVQKTGSTASATAADRANPKAHRRDGIELAPVVGHGGAKEPSVNPARKLT